MPFRIRYVLGLVGRRWTGKSTVIAHLVEKEGFRVYSLSMTLRRIAVDLGVDPASRVALQDLGDDLRRKGGTDILARQTLRFIRSDNLAHRETQASAPRVVVSGFKRPEEVSVFGSLNCFELLGLAASDERRYDRAISSGSASSELLDLPQLTPLVVKERLDARDRFGNEDDPNGQAVDEVVKLVPQHRTIENEAGTVAELLSDVNKHVRQLDLQYRLPRGG